MGHIDIATARTMRDKAGYSSYTGRPIEGPRFEMTPDDPRFPAALSRIPRPPQKLYVLGNPAALTIGLAVIGSRRMTPYGRSCAHRFAFDASQRGIIIISGGALGCDSIAHRAALDAGTPTVAVLGGGIDEPYPRRNVDLFRSIVEGGGALVSEREWAFPPLPFTFRERNRLIAGMAAATLIVEAGLPSGTFSTADEALAANRDVLVVPGAITSPASAGANRLLYQGATPIVDDDTFDDALFSLFGVLKRPPVPAVDTGADDAPASGLRADLLAMLRAEPLGIDRIVAQLGSGADAQRVSVELARLKLGGAVDRYPDGKWGPAG